MVRAQLWRSLLLHVADKVLALVFLESEHLRAVEVWDVRLSNLLRVLLARFDDVAHLDG